MIAYVVNNVTRKEKGREASIAASVESATRRLVVEPFADAETAGSTKVALEVRKPDGQGVQGERRMMDPLATEKAYLKKHLNELASAHPGKFLLIKGDQVHGAFETHEQGVIEGARQFGAGPFLVRSVLQPDDPKPLNIPALTAGISLVAYS